MATLQALCDAQAIHRWDAALDEDEQELRLLYASDAVMQFVASGLDSLQSYFDGIDPKKELAALIAEFASGLPMEFGRHIKPFRRHAFHSVQGGVWYLRTADLRIFGWFPKRDCFVAVFPDTFENIKGNNFYEGRRNQVIHFRNQLALDEPKFIAGDDPHAVLSNCTVTN